MFFSSAPLLLLVSYEHGLVSFYLRWVLNDTYSAPLYYINPCLVLRSFFFFLLNMWSVDTAAADIRSGEVGVGRLDCNTAVYFEVYFLAPRV